MNSKQERTKETNNCSFPNRHDGLYKNIENIQNFEFTHSIVYEFARRNKNTNKILNFLNDLFSIYENLIHGFINTYRNYLLNNKSKENENIKKAEELINPVINKCLYEIVKFHNQEELKKQLEDLSIKNIKERLCKIVEILTNRLYNDYYIIYTTEFPSLFKNINDIYDPTVNLERDKLLTEILNNLDLDDYKYNIENNDFFNIFQIISNQKKEIKLNIIYPKYKTAMRDFTDIKVALNLNLPENEITDFIKKIKANYDSENSIIKTPLELFGEKLEIDTKDLKRNNKWADLFFIYDYYNIGIENKKKKTDIEKEIQLIFTKIYGVKVMKEDLEIDKTKKFNIIPYEKFMKVNNLEESELDLNELEDEKHYYTTRSIRAKYTEVKDYIIGNNPKYKTLIYK